MSCSPHCAPCNVPNEIDYGKINVDTNSGTAYPPEQPHWHEDIKKHWRSSGVFIVTFEKISHLSLVFPCWIWGSVADCIYQQRSKYRQVKIIKHASTGTNYTILIKWVKVQHEEKPVSNLKSA